MDHTAEVKKTLGEDREEKDQADPIVVNVRWWDGYLETFEAQQVRQGGHILWMRLTNGQNRTIPLLQNVRWFSTDPESHAGARAM